MPLGLCARRFGLRAARDLLTVVGSMAASHASHAGGLILYEFPTAEVELAAAGYAARAQDASTAFTNPAGMAPERHAGAGRAASSCG